MKIGMFSQESSIKERPKRSAWGQHDARPNVYARWVYSFLGLVSVANGALNLSSRIAGTSFFAKTFSNRLSACFPI